MDAPLLYPTADGTSTTRDAKPHARAASSMTRQEKRWWAMSFEDLYEHAKDKGFGDGRKTGRKGIIRWLCKQADITPYTIPLLIPAAAPTTANADQSQQTPEHLLRPTGAISHPEAVLMTSDPEKQKLIDAAQREYLKWHSAEDLLQLCMQRSYQLLKDSSGKLPSKSKKAMATWLAAWDVLKSPREKAWWLGDGIDLVNKAKAMGYNPGPEASKYGVKKYDVIVWLRNTPEDAEGEVVEVAEPTPNQAPKRKRRGDEGGIALELAKRVSRRPAKGSTRLGLGAKGWGFG